MADTPTPEEAEREWLIQKGSYYYRPNRSGYTAFRFDAGLYTEAEARREAAIEPHHMLAIHRSDAPEYLGTEGNLAELCAALASRDALIAADRARLAAQSAAIAEAVKALGTLIETADRMPKETPAPGGAATVHTFHIAAGTVWTLDQACDRARAALDALKALEGV